MDHRHSRGCKRVDLGQCTSPRAAAQSARAKLAGKETHAAPARYAQDAVDVDRVEELKGC